MKILRLVIHCGKGTCASEPGVFCQYVGTRRMGTYHVCRLFPSAEDSYTTLEEKDGWLQRCPACLEAQADPDPISA